MISQNDIHKFFIGILLKIVLLIIANFLIIVYMCLCHAFNAR